MLRLRLQSLVAALLLVSLFATGASAQSPREEIAADPLRAGGIYYTYHPASLDVTPAPRGFKPFYISHYGRHGSRWAASEKSYARVLRTLRTAADDGVLTPLGERLLADVELICAHAQKHAGDLSPLGRQEHAAIAQRMYDNYPEVFRGECDVDCHATLVTRCIISMVSFTDGLHERNPKIRFRRDATAADSHFVFSVEGMNAARAQTTARAEEYRHSINDPDALFGRLFTEPGYADRRIADKYKVYDNLFSVAMIMQCVDLDVDIRYVFTDEELYNMWRGYNIQRYLTYGPSAEWGDNIVADARPLLRNIIDNADKAAAGELGYVATLRFGHDINVIPLAALLELEGATFRSDDYDAVCENWIDYRVSPMATNLQFVFFRNKAGEVLIKVLFSEKECRLPVATDIFPFYRWEDFKAYYEPKIL